MLRCGVDEREIKENQSITRRVVNINPCRGIKSATFEFPGHIADQHPSPMVGI
jgi:hypothetical protein